MDAFTFDAMVRRLGSGLTRRQALRRVLAGASGATVAGTVRQEALACRQTGKPCAKGNKTKQRRSCCSGTCKRGRCRSTPGAKGCTVNQDVCKTNTRSLCPKLDLPTGFCVVLDSGKPFCYGFIECQACTSHADCTAGPNGKCVTTCPACETEMTTSACVYPHS